MVEIFLKYQLQRMKNEIRYFCGKLPVEELANNEKLTQKIEELESQLRGLLDDEQTA